MAADRYENTCACTWASEFSKGLASLALQVGNMCPRKKHMAHLLLAPFASHLYELAAIMKEMQREAEMGNLNLPAISAKGMESHLKASQQLVEAYSGRSSLYLLMCSPDLLAQLKRIYTGLKATLDSLSSDADWSVSLKMRCSEEMQALQQSLSVKLGRKEQSLHDSLEQGVLDSIVTDSALTIKLAKQIAEAAGFDSSCSLDSESFANEVSELKMEKDGAERRRGVAHALYLQQFIILLEKARAATSLNNMNENFGSPQSAPRVEINNKLAHRGTKSGGGGGGPVGRAGTAAAALPAVRDTLALPLRSFICPITQDVMRDPVQIASGQTYERQAIERWFAEGHTRCPAGGVELANTNMKSNIALKQSIAEWKERNNTIRLDSATKSMQCGRKEQQLTALRDLNALCQEDSLSKYKVASRSLVPLLVRVAESGDLELRVSAFSLLGVLADNEECQELMAKEKVINIMVRCLARQNEEAAQCVQLMRTLSSNPDIAHTISRVPSALIFLVTLLHDEQCADNVKAILENLPKSDENVVIMAEANVMKPLIERLNHSAAGENEGASKILMATTLGRLHMPDASKTIAATEETMRTLANMAASSREEEREAAVLALENLSSVPAARQGLRRVGASGTLLNVLCEGGRHSSEAAQRASAATLANVWAAADDDENDLRMSDAEVEEAVRILLERLVPPTPMQVQLAMLHGLLALASSNGTRDVAAVRRSMNENGAFTCLLCLFGFLSSDDHYVKLDSGSSMPTSCSADLMMQLRCSCLELLACLASPLPAEEAAHAVRSNPSAIHGLANLITADNPREPELLAAVSFVAHLPTTEADITRLMTLESGFVQALMRLFKQHRNQAIVEAAAGALLRFTTPDDPSMQAALAKAGVIQAYVGLLRSGEGPVSREWAGEALRNFSESSWELSSMAEEAATQVKRVWTCVPRWSRRARWQLCRVHGGQCSIEGTFCLVQADAVCALAEVLLNNGGDQTRPAEGGGSAAAALPAAAGAQTAALMALSTLVKQPGHVEEGCAAIERAGAWSTIIAFMSSSTPSLQDTAARLCEQLFSIPRYRTQYAARAQIHIITLAQCGAPRLKQLAGRLLRHLDLLHISQSDYFGGASSSST